MSQEVPSEQRPEYRREASQGTVGRRVNGREEQQGQRSWVKRMLVYARSSVKETGEQEGMSSDGYLGGKVWGLLTKVYIVL